MTNGIVIKAIMPGTSALSVHIPHEISTNKVLAARDTISAFGALAVINIEDERQLEWNTVCIR